MFAFSLDDDIIVGHNNNIIIWCFNCSVWFASLMNGHIYIFSQRRCYGALYTQPRPLNRWAVFGTAAAPVNPVGIPAVNSSYPSL